MTVRSVVACFVSLLAGPALGGQEGARVPPAESSDAPDPSDLASDLAETAPRPPAKPPDGILPVGELSRLGFTPRDNPKPLLYGVHLLVVGSSGFVEGHDAETGEFLWKLGLPGERLHDPVVFDVGPLNEGRTDTFTVVVSEPGGHVLLVDGLTGEIRQERRLPFELALPPIRGPDDIVFLATPSGDIVAYDVEKQEVTFQTATGERPLALASSSSLVVVSGASQKLTALDFPSGAVRWSFTGRAGFYAPAAFDEALTRVYAGDDTGELYSLDAESGRVEFQWSTGAAIRSPVLVEGKRIYVATYANSVYAFHGMTGDEHWRANLPGRPATPPMRVRNRLLVGTFDGILIELVPGNGKPGKRYSAPGEIVNPPTFFLARPTANELLAEEAAALFEETDDEAVADDEPDEEPILDPVIFGPEEIDEDAPPDTSSVDEVPDVETLEALTSEGLDEPEVPREPMWFERSRIAMALRNGEVLLLAHESAVPKTTEPIEEEPAATEVPPTGR